jgi:glycosyltransferase involved in cell wall biosynthesis
LQARICIVAVSPMTMRAFIAPHLAAMQATYQVTAVANAAGGEPRPVGPGVVFISIPIGRRISPLSDLIALARLVRLIRRSRFTAIQSLMPKAGLLAMLAGFLTRVPVRVHIFTGQVWVTRRGAARRFFKLMDRVTAACATHVLVDSPSQRDFLIAEGVVSAEKSRVLGKGSVSGVDASRFRPNPEARKAVRERLGLPGDAVVFLYLGRLTRDKGVLDLAAAFARVATAGRDLRLLVVGPDEDGLRSRMEEALGAAVARACFVGYTDRAEEYMTAADVSCLPSYREGFGVTVIEAAACGIPSIGSRIYGVTDAIEEGTTGLMFEAGKVEDLARCMVRLATDSALRRALGARARERALRDFRAESLVGDLQRYLASAIGPARR